MLESLLGGLSEGFELIDLCAYLHAESGVMGSQINAVFGEYKSAELALIILKQKLLSVMLVSESGVYA